MHGTHDSIHEKGPLLMLRTLIFMTFLSTVAMTACVADQDDGAGAASTGTAPLIRTAQDLDAYLRTTTRSPLDRLSPLARQRFLDSLVFADTGLGGFQYSDLEAELSQDEIHQILGLFAMEHVTMLITGGVAKDERQRDLRPRDGDYPDMLCESHATCAPRLGYICTAHC